jgi:hypothetical protein
MEALPASTAAACLLTPNELDALRAATSSAALDPASAAVQCRIGLLSSAPAPASSPANLSSAALPPSSEHALVSHWASIIGGLCSPKAEFPDAPGLQNRMRRPEEVQCTANIFLRRFFVSNSVVNFDPCRVMLACVFLASKIEDAVLDSRNLSAASEALGKEVPAKDIVEHEPLVLQAMGFQLQQVHGYRPLKAFAEDLRLYTVRRGWYDKQQCPDFTKLYLKARAWMEEVSWRGGGGRGGTGGD